MTPTNHQTPHMLSATDNVTRVAQLIARARGAQQSFAKWPQDRVDIAVAAAGWTIYEESTASRLVALAHNESSLGDREDSLARHRQRVIGILADLHNVVTTGIISEDRAAGIRRLAKPVGVVAAVTPATAPTASIAQNALLALKTRNAVIFSPNPRARKAALATVEELRGALLRIGAPLDLVQCLNSPDRQQLQELMENVDLILAAGGQNTVRRAYSSGKPAYGAGVGNAIAIIDESANIQDACSKIHFGKSFDNGTSCSSESCLLVAEDVWTLVTDQLCALGAHLCGAAEVQRLRTLAWPDGRTLNREIVGKSAQVVAKLAGFDIPPGTRVLLAALEGGIDDDPFGTEKLSPILAIWKYNQFHEAIDYAGRLTSRSGRGHSCALHTMRPERVKELAGEINVSRVLVNQSTGSGNSGSVANGLPFTSILCCGTWGGSVSNENITWRHLLNYTWVSESISRHAADEQELFRGFSP
jgi:sulfoacetaldehyde dehydrogenase